MQPPPRKTSPRLRKKNIIRRASRKRLQSPRLSRSRSEGKTMKRIRLRQLKTLLIKLTNQRSPSQQKNLRRLRRPTPSKSPPKRRSPSRSLTQHQRIVNRKIWMSRRMSSLTAAALKTPSSSMKTTQQHKNSLLNSRSRVMSSSIFLSRFLPLSSRSLAQSQPTWRQRVTLSLVTRPSKPSATTTKPWASKSSSPSNSNKHRWRRLV